MKPEIIVLFLAIVGISGCATPYQDNGFLGGVSASPLGESVYEVRAGGNGFTSAVKIQDYVLLKSAEICRQNNYTHFIPITEKDMIAYGDKPHTKMRIKLLRETDGIPDTAFSCSIIYDRLSLKYMD